MRRRALPLLLAAAAAVLALLRRSRRSQARPGPRYVDQPSAPVLPAPETADDAVIDGGAGDHDVVPNAQVEGEPGPRESPAAANAIHNAAAAGGAGDAAVASPTAARDSPFRSVAWALLDGQPAADATELRIGFSLIARRESLARVDVRETASQVFVTVLARREAPAPGAETGPACAEARQATVALDQPLGDRTLVHAPVEDPAPSGPAPEGPASDGPAPGSPAPEGPGAGDAAAG